MERKPDFHSSSGEPAQVIKVDLKRADRVIREQTQAAEQRRARRYTEIVQTWRAARNGAE